MSEGTGSVEKASRFADAPGGMELQKSRAPPPMLPDEMKLPTQDAAVESVPAVLAV